MSCRHEQFQANVNVNRISDVEDGPIVAYSADVTIHCRDCGETFVFLGMGKGLHPTRPMTSPFGEEARLPIRPSSEIHRPLPVRTGPTGFRVREGH